MMENVEIICSTGSEPGIAPLNCLRANAETYTVGMIQPSGSIVAAPGFVGNADHDEAIRKHREFLAIARSRNWDLVLSPEYSCSWEALVDALANGDSPGKGKLWVLGCEGITPEELGNLRDTHDGFSWRFEDLDTLDFEGKQYLDPVCYVMQTTDNRPFVLVQFKGSTMADPDGEHERLHMVRGKTRYIMRNRVSTVYLTALICSDSLDNELTTEICANMKAEPMLFIHLQLNKDPRNESFASFRRSAYSEGREGWEFIALNWARGTEIPGIGILEFGGSAYYSSSPDFLEEDSRFNHNHKLGMYYTYGLNNRITVYYFNYNEHVYSFSTTKACIRGASGPQRGNKRTGPKMIRAYRWDACAERWLGDATPNDGFEERCAAYEANHRPLHPLSRVDLAPLDRERLLELSTGEAGGTGRRPWSCPRNLTSTGIPSTEVLKRIAFCQDPDPSYSDAWENQVSLLAELRNTILTNKILIPKELGDLRDNPLLAYPIDKENLSCNLKSTNGDAKGTGVYIGSALSTRAQTVFARMHDLEGVEQTSLAVWYSMGGTVNCCVNSEIRLDKTTENPADFARGDNAHD